MVTIKEFVNLIEPVNYNSPIEIYFVYSKRLQFYKEHIINFNNELENEDGYFSQIDPAIKFNSVSVFKKYINEYTYLFSDIVLGFRFNDKGALTIECE